MPEKEPLTPKPPAAARSQIQDMFGQRSFPGFPFVNINADYLKIQVVLSPAEQKTGMGAARTRGKDDMGEVFGLRAELDGQLPHGLDETGRSGGI